MASSGAGDFDPFVDSAHSPDGNRLEEDSQGILSLFNCPPIPNTPAAHGVAEDPALCGTGLMMFVDDQLFCSLHGPSRNSQPTVLCVINQSVQYFLN